MVGLLAGALKGGGEALQENAQMSLQEKRERALLKIQHDQQEELKKTQWNREDKAAAATAKRENQQRLQDRQWELSDSKTEHQRALELQKARNQGGYGNRPTAKQKEAQWLVDNGIAPSLDDAWPMVSSGNESDKQDYIDNRVEELSTVLEDPDFAMSFSTEEQASRERERMRKELNYYKQQRDQMARERYKIQPPGFSNSSPQPTKTAPDAALNYLRGNNTQEVRQQFRAKYGYLPEGLQ